MAVCREVDTGRIELLLPFKISLAAFSPCPVLTLSSIFFMQLAGDLFGSNSGRGYLTLARSTGAFLSRVMRGRAEGSGASRPVPYLAQVLSYMV